ncbi:ganglioside GM2 activator-like [Haliotis cracherodii]|uniref:ganglioside GM2 activator-like n=1 Tax=Haliotis cracherodii TaxID=6455 RepID=UPI0039EB83CB
MLLLVVALIVPALGARPGFTDTGSLEWRDCGFGDSWVSVKQFDITPLPIKLPGDMTVSLEVEIKQYLSDQFTMDVFIEKKLLGIFIKVPCFHDLGTCHHTDPCNILYTLQQQGSCPPQLSAYGLSCICPFSPKTHHMPPTRFTVSISDAWRIFIDGEFHIKITMHDKMTKQLRGCVETYLEIAA